jgi:plasmid maintenance system killer protein
MRISFKDREVERICNESDYCLKKYPPKIVNALQLLLTRLAAYPKFEAFNSPMLRTKYRTHELQGDKKGIYSLSIDYSYRLTLTVYIQEIEDEIIILEVSKHYGD